MYNIQKAVSRLDYAPKLKEIKVTNIKKGIGVFTPKPDKPLSFAALKDTLKKAGYALNSATLRIEGKLTREENAWFLTNPVTGQRFAIVGDKAPGKLQSREGALVEVEGDWKTIGQGKNTREEIALFDAKTVGASAPAKASFKTTRADSPAQFIFATYDVPSVDRFDSGEVKNAYAKPAAPIRVTSPGLTVYKGGAVTPRVYLIKQHLGDLEVSRQLFDLSISYTPSPRVQWELEIPISRSAYDQGLNSGAGTGLGNITLWSKYRFFRKVKTYGDRQAAVRLGLELPTGKKDAPSLAQVNAPEFVRQQLTPISGGFSPHFDLAFSQAGGRFIFGGNVEAIVRSERDGFRMGHELRVSTDSEYVLLPRKYDAPGGELFVILETTFVHRGPGRLGGVSVSGSNSTEYYLAPGLQYAAAPQFVIEGSYQFPIARNTGPLVLRNDRNILLGVRYLF